MLGDKFFPRTHRSSPGKPRRLSAETEFRAPLFL